MPSVEVATEPMAVGTGDGGAEGGNEAGDEVGDEGEEGGVESFAFLAALLPPTAPPMIPPTRRSTTMPRNVALRKLRMRPPEARVGDGDSRR